MASNQLKYGNFNRFDRMETRMGPMTAAQMIKHRTKMGGAEAGKAARFAALDKMIRRRQQLKAAEGGSPGGVVRPGGQYGYDLSQEEMQKRIKKAGG